MELHLLDLFYKTLSETDEMSKAIDAVRKELLKRKINIPKTSDTYESLERRHTALVGLNKKLRKIQKMKMSNLLDKEGKKLFQPQD